jgi:hypothetical protein
VRCEDQELLLRTYRRSTFANLERPLLGYREPTTKARLRLQGRVNYLRLGGRSVIRQQGWRATTGFSWHLLKGIVDLAAEALGVESVIFRLGGVPASIPERNAWHDALAAAAAAMEAAAADRPRRFAV